MYWMDTASTARLFVFINPIVLWCYRCRSRSRWYELPIDQASSVKMAGYWPSSLFAFYGPRRSQKKKIFRAPAWTSARIKESSHESQLIVKYMIVLLLKLWTGFKINWMPLVAACLLPVLLSLRPSRSIRFGDVAEGNGREKPCFFALTTWPERIEICLGTWQGYLILSKFQVFLACKHVWSLVYDWTVVFWSVRANV